VQDGFEGVQGWREFLTAKREMISAYTSACEKAGGRPTPYFDPGRVAEGVFRRWLAGFLPARYGVTSGYIISTAASDIDPVLHFDVIIYDKLESPVLWREDNPDSSEQGHSLAIPVEYVLAVLEVKSSLTKVAASDAIKKLRELSPLLARLDLPGEYYPKYLPPRFSCGVCFFKADPRKTVDELAPLAVPDIRGYFGGIVLSSAEDPSWKPTAKIEILAGQTPMHSTKKSIVVPDGGTWSDSYQFHGLYYTPMIYWSLNSLADFAFSLLRRLQGTYDPRRAASWHGFATTAASGWRENHSLKKQAE
jgi:hypothetical protein